MKLNLFPIYFTFFILIILCHGCKTKHSLQSEITLDNWKFIAGDSLEYADPDFNINNWKKIDPFLYWESQGYKNYNGYAWYRASFFLSSDLKKNAWFKDSIIISLGKIDDTDQLFLNGKLTGQNNVVLPNGSLPGKFEGNKESYRWVRRYVLSVSDPRLEWDKENVIAIRVHDHYGQGGLYESGNQSISMLDIKDFISIDQYSHPFEMINNEGYSKTIICSNNSDSFTFEGKFIVSVLASDSEKEIYSQSSSINLAPGEKIKKTFTFNSDFNELSVARYEMWQNGAKFPVMETEAIPYILTPRASEIPKINGPKVYGSRPGNQFLYALPVSGKRPVTFSAKDLPIGLVLDAETGIITGTTPAKGEYPVTFSATNELGSDTKIIKIISGSQLALTPTMGWNSWNCWGLSVDAEKVKLAADFMVSSGLRDHGWTYINIDDGWEAAQRNSDGTISGNDKFPDFKELSDYVHSKGLKLGIYSSPGPLTCGGYLGSYNHEMHDAEKWAEWGIDYIKYDWCSYGEIAKDNSLAELQKPYILMNNALNQINRDIVYSLCQYGMGNVWEWGNEVGGNLWRTTGDIVDTWNSLSGIGFNQTQQYPFAGPGHWNDPDMLIVGWVGWGPQLHPTRLTVSEQYTHISLWALLSAPLLLGNDLSKLDDFTLNLLTNDEVLAINQDPLGKQAQQVIKKDNIQVWMKELEDESLAIGIFNLSNSDQIFDLKWTDLGLEQSQEVYDVWRQKKMGNSNHFSSKILSHGVQLIKVSKITSN